MNTQKGLRIMGLAFVGLFISSSILYIIKKDPTIESSKQKTVTINYKYLKGRCIFSIVNLIIAIIMFVFSNFITNIYDINEIMGIKLLIYKLAVVIASITAIGLLGLGIVSTIYYVPKFLVRRHKIIKRHKRIQKTRALKGR